MSSKEYGFSDEVKNWAHKNSKGFGDGEKKDVHHIVPRSIARKYRLNKDKITSKDNAIALEMLTFHREVHEIFEEEDFIFLAQVVLGFTEEDFEREYPRTNTSRKRKKRKRR